LKAGAALALAGFHGTHAEDFVFGQEISSTGGINVTVFTDGRYKITASGYGWAFSGSIGSVLRSIRLSDGADAVGTWHQVAFDYDPSRSSSIRIYDGKPLVLFSTSYGQDGPNKDPFPSFDSYPQDLFTFSYTSLWNYQFGVLNPRSPWLFYDSQANAILLSPAANFMTAVTQFGDNSAIQGAIDGRITSLPAGFSHSTILTFGRGINAAFDTWGHALTDLYGKKRPANDSIALLNKLSYWTDAWANYYYHPGDPTQYVPTLLQVPGAYQQFSTPVGSMELDSWYYPKGSPPNWTQNGFGMATYKADPAIFPNGLAAFQKSLGLPLITHARWIDATSDLRNHYKMSGNVSIDPQYWKDYAQYLSDSGVEVLEQDWLSGPAVADFNLTDPDAFLDNMASAMQSAGHSIVYCMPLWTHIMQSSKYNNVLAARVSPDGFNRNHWDSALIDSRIASAVGLWPFADAFGCRNHKDILLATLTAGPIGAGDALGTVECVGLKQAVRTDGVIVKPDVPIAISDVSWVALSQDQSAPVIASTYTDHDGRRTAYVFAYGRTEGALNSIVFSPESTGVQSPAYVLDYFSKSGTVVPSGAQYNDIVDYNASYYVVAPIGPSGMAFLGDTDKFVSCGKKRIEELNDYGSLVRVVIRFAPGEKHIGLHMYAPSKPLVWADSGTVGRPVSEYGDRYRVTVFPDSAGSAIVNLSLLHSPAK